MSVLIICRGLPASGKTTRARAWVAEDPISRARVNRDDFRKMIHDGVHLGRDTENQIRAARDASISTLLAKGIDVVCDDTNLPQRVARDIAKLGQKASATIKVWDMTDVPLDVCISRDAARPDGVGEDVIRDMHARFVAGASYPLPPPEEPESGEEPVRLYVAPTGAQGAILVDVDGTLALHGTRSPFDETRVYEDRPNENVVAVVRALADRYAVIYCSGRTDGCRAATEDWIRSHVGDGWEALFMRAAGDMRKDAVVKREIFDREIRDRYDVVAVLDDRQQVVDAWRELGLTVLQVAPGNF